MRRTKFNAKRTEVYGITFDSKMEADRYCNLRILEKAGKIFDLQLQPKFKLLEDFTLESGEKIRGVSYIADFSYLKQGDEKRTIEDVKGKPTKDYLLKKKFFLSRYGNKYHFLEFKL